jgi:very-short-patch-repair endonuclease
MSDAEVRVWVRLRAQRVRGLHFRRQSPIGPFVVDFECRKARLIIEIDGSQHNEINHATRDIERDRVLSALGYQVVRYPAQAAMFQTDEIAEDIIKKAVPRLPVR